MDGLEMDDELMDLLLSQQQPDPEAQRREQAMRRQRAAGNLALLTGDRVLGDFGRAQLQQVSQVDPTALRGETLQQGRLRLALQAQAEKRRADLATQKLGQDKDIAQQRLAADRARAAAAAAPGPKKLATIPAGEAAAIAQTEAATKALQTLLGQFNSRSAAGISGRIQAAMPWDSDPKKYDDDVLSAAQAVGTILEGGKLAAGDEVKYRKMLPAAGDTPERARNKIQNVVRLIQEAKQDKLKGLGQAGYDVSGFAADMAERPDLDLTVPPVPAGSGNQPAPSGSGSAGSQGGGNLRTVSVKGMKPGDLAASLKEGEKVRISGSGQVVQKKGGKLIKVKE